MDIIIYAAGMGSRMGKNIPKALLNIKGKPLLYHQLKAAAHVFPGARALIIAGYQFDLMKKAISRFNDIDLKIELIRNPFYEAGILTTAWIAALSVKSTDVLRIDGDVFFTSNELESLKKIKKSTILVSDAKHQKRSPEIKMENNTFREIVLREQYSGPNEWICVERYLHNDYKKIMDMAFDYLPSSAYFYEAINNYVSATKADIFAIKHVSHIYEMDTQEDYKKLIQELSHHGK